MRDISSVFVYPVTKPGRKLATAAGLCYSKGDKGKMGKHGKDMHLINAGKGEDGLERQGRPYP